jgi:hypothetical protein
MCVAYTRCLTEAGEQSKSLGKYVIISTRAVREMSFEVFTNACGTRRCGQELMRIMMFVVFVMLCTRVYDAAADDTAMTHVFESDFDVIYNDTTLPHGYLMIYR